MKRAPKPPRPRPAQPPPVLGEACPYEFDQLVTIGKVGKVHGVQGAFHCVAITDYPERFEETERVHLHNGKPPVRTVQVESARYRSGRVILKLVGVDSPAAAESIKHWLICAGEDELVELEDGEYFHFELEGLRAIDEYDQPLGILREVLTTPAHEIYCLDTPHGEVLVPAVSEFVLALEPEKGFVKLRLPIMDDAPES